MEGVAAGGALCGPWRRASRGSFGVLASSILDEPGAEHTHMSEHTDQCSCNRGSADDVRIAFGKAEPWARRRRAAADQSRKATFGEIFVRNIIVAKRAGVGNLGWHWSGVTRACRPEEHQLTAADGCRSHRQWWRCGSAGRKSWRLRPNRSGKKKAAGGASF